MDENTEPQVEQSITKLPKEFAKALVKALSQVKPAVKDAENPHFRSKYANLESVIEAVRKPLTDNGLAFVQEVCPGRGACVQTILIHESGEIYAFRPIDIPVSKADAQGYGSALTYAKRYSLQTALGVPTSDDDGNDAAKNPPRADKRPNDYQHDNQYVPQHATPVKVPAKAPETVFAHLYDVGLIDPELLDEAVTYLEKNGAQQVSKWEWRSTKPLKRLAQYRVDELPKLAPTVEADQLPWEAEAHMESIKQEGANEA